MSIFGFKILSRLIQSTIGDLDRIPKSNEILTMPVEAQKSFQNFWVNFDCTFIDISNKFRNKEIKNYVVVKVVIDMVCGNTRKQ